MDSVIENVPKMELCGSPIPKVEKSLAEIGIREEGHCRHKMDGWIPCHVGITVRLYCT